MTTIISRSTDAVTFTPDLVFPFEAEDEPGTVVQPILGSDRVDITLRPATASAGTIRMLFLTFADAEAARLMMRAAAVFLIASDLPWLPSGFVPAGSIRRAQQDPQLQRWILDVPYREVSA
jgi:hypothetical protein